LGPDLDPGRETSQAALTSGAGGPGDGPDCDDQPAASATTTATTCLRVTILPGPRGRPSWAPLARLPPSSSKRGPVLLSNCLRT